METVYRIGGNEREQAQAVLTSAFHEEIEILTKKYGLKRRTVEGIFSTPLGLDLSKGEVHASSGLISLLTSGAFFRASTRRGCSARATTPAGSVAPGARPSADPGTRADDASAGVVHRALVLEEPSLAFEPS